MVGVGHHDRDELVAQAVAKDEGLRNKGRAHVHVLDLLGRDVLPLRQLEDVLLAVNDLQAAARQPRAHVACARATGVLVNIVVSSGKSGSRFDYVFNTVTC